MVGEAFGAGSGGLDELSLNATGDIGGCTTGSGKNCVVEVLTCSWLEGRADLRGHKRGGIDMLIYYILL